MEKSVLTNAYERMESMLQSYLRETMKSIDDVNDFYRCGVFEIAVNLKNGDKDYYNDMTKRVVRVRATRDFEGRMTDESWKREFSIRLRARMQYIGYTQTRLAAQTDISQATISKYVHGKAIPNHYHLQRIAEVLHCSVTELTEFDI